jgi:Flp pilus assembly protein TadD
MRGKALEWSKFHFKPEGKRQTSGRNPHPSIMRNAANLKHRHGFRPFRVFVGLMLLAGLITLCVRAFAGDIKIEIPKRSHLTPVQRLNREGVEALRKRNYEKAEKIFYRAYLFDPEDPFTLNNLGYIAELKGQVERAHNFYTLASHQASDAVIDVATTKSVEGHPMEAALNVPSLPLQINHDNVEAVRLLSQGRAPEADVLLQQALARDPNNVFTMNNLGVAKEMEGETQQALKLYGAAAAAHSDAAAVVTLNRQWRGKPVSEMAAQNAKALRARMETQNTLAARVAEFNLRGVSAINRNDIQAAMQDFREAYRLDPTNAFALNNVGYLYELQGDRETAQFYYESALKAGGANVAVGLATRRSAEGLKLFEVAGDSNGQVGNQLTVEREARRREAGPVLLRRRDNSIVQEPAPPPQSQPQR